MRDLRMVVNAHIDPIWQWTWEEGAAEAVSTFRTAAELCEEHDSFMFNHNEALLYQWVEEYEPELFERIRELVRRGKWHIMGGWFLQPDCNQPCGESFVRQILTGNKYFYEKFGVKPRTAVNFDVFGHSRGLVQILRKAGYDSYIFCRPDAEAMDAPDDFKWLGFDGSHVLAHRSRSFYNSEVDRAAEKIEFVSGRMPETGVVFWGVGNHGGGASREDVKNVDHLIHVMKEQGVNLMYSSAGEYFEAISETADALPEYDKTLWYCSTGCYTTQIRVKQKHRKLEAEYLLTEKMASHVSMLSLAEYPKDELDKALYDILLSEFHDALPGTSIQKAEDEIIRMLDHGLELLSRIRMKCLILLSSGIQPSEPGDVTVLAYNPQPYPVRGVWNVEVMPFRPHWGEGFKNPVMYMDGHKIPCQYEKPDINGSHDWRKGVSFLAELKAQTVCAFVCKFEVIPEKPVIRIKEEDGQFVFKTEELHVIINAKTGLMDKYAANGVDYVNKSAFMPVVMEDSHDSWNIVVSSYRNMEGKFELAGEDACAAFSGTLTDRLPGVHVTEDGEVRTIIEAVFTYKNSALCQRYILPKKGTEIRIDSRVYWNERRKMLKLVVPLRVNAPHYFGHTAFGTEKWPADGRETVSQKWVGVYDANKSRLFTVINDGNGGSDFADGELRLTLLRSPAYTASFSHDPDNAPHISPDRFNLYIDQGERFFSFRVNAGPFGERMGAVCREAQANAEAPVFVPFTPPKTSVAGQPKAMVILSNGKVELTAVKRAETSGEYVIRLFAPDGNPQEVAIDMPALGIRHTERLGAYEIVSLLTDTKGKRLFRTDLLEGMIPGE